MTVRKYCVLLAVIVFSSCGDASLARGMRDFGAVTMGRLPHLLTALFSPWILGGILLLMFFFASYLTALSWADLTYVLPATAASYVMMAVLGKYFLHENVTLWRWIGIGLITAGVGFVASGPEKTPGIHRSHTVGLPLVPGTGSDT